LREVLLAYRELRREQDLEAYRFESLRYTIAAPYLKKGDAKPPEPSELLREP